MTTHRILSVCRTPRAVPSLVSALCLLAGVARSAAAAEPAPKPADDPLQVRAELLARMGVDRWQAAGFRGQGVKVAILDTGFHGYRSHLGKTLPAHVTARSFRHDGNMEARASQHGILCAEVFHAIAPEAELLFANWDMGEVDQFLAAVRWARSLGARVISCSVVTPSWSDGEGGGSVHRNLAALLGGGSGDDDLLFFASAGNTTDRHWGGAFRDGGDGFHEWAPGQPDNPLRPWGTDRVAVELYGPPGSNYVLSVYEAASDKEVGSAHTDPHQPDRTSAALRFQPETGHTYRVRVRRGQGPAGPFNLTTTFASLHCTTPGHNVCFPADGADVVALGAVDGEYQRKWYSACGPNSPRPKPDLVAAVPFPVVWRTRPFGGTSAAAPQAAGLAALCLSRYPHWTPDQTRTALRAAARDLGDRGTDLETGAGLIHLPPPE